MIARARFVLAACLIGFAAGCVSTAKMGAAGEPLLSAESRREIAERVSAGWSETSRLSARLFISRYGAPDEIGSSRLIWHGNGPWKRTIVRDKPRLYSGVEDLGVIEQTVAYDVTPEAAAGLAPFSRRLSFDTARMEMSSWADREEVNFLRLNLADDVLRGRISPQEAQDSYARVIELESAGKRSRYLLGLTFGPGRPKTP